MPGQCGALFAIHDRVVGVEVFDSPAILAAVLGKLIESYALDALDATQTTGVATPSRAWLDALAGTATETFAAVGDGEDWRRFGRGLTGGALVVDERLIHLCAFAVGDRSGQRPGAGSAGGGALPGGAQGQDCAMQVRFSDRGQRLAEAEWRWTWVDSARRKTQPRDRAVERRVAHYLASQARLAASAAKRTGDLEQARAHLRQGAETIARYGADDDPCRSSALFATLQGDMMYAHHATRPLPDSTNWAILSPEVPVYRTDEGTLLDAPWPLSVITCAAPDAPSVGMDVSATLMESRIRRVLAIARAFEYEALVLGAWGCGTYGNDPARIAAIFRTALLEQAGAFVEVVFAVTDGSPQRTFFAPFAAELGGSR